MLLDVMQAILRRDIAGVRRSVEAYPDDETPWEQRPGLPNAGGTLALHVAGNIQHYIGAALGRSGYRRDRDAEFARRGVPRGEMLAELDAADRAVVRGFAELSERSLDEAFPEPIAKRTVTTEAFLVHIATHLAYHLGQIDYHRRVVTGDRTSIGAVAGGELPAADVGADARPRLTR
jgi:uncharacterized damage-inducible protein DinB